MLIRCFGQLLLDLIKFGALVNLASEICWFGFDWNFFYWLLNFKNLRILGDLHKCVVGDTSVVMG